MDEKKKLLQAAFDMALQTTIVKQNQTDNADLDIKAAMIDYILFAAVGLNSDEISDFIKENGSAFSKLESSFMSTDCTSESSFFVTKQF